MNLFQRYAKLKPSHRRYILYAIGVALLSGAYLWRTWWSPAVVIETEHYRIMATADDDYTSQSAEILESFYNTYSNLMDVGPVEHELMHVRLYASRQELHESNLGIPSWAEGFYRNGVTHQYQEDQGRFCAI